MSVDSCVLVTADEGYARRRWGEAKLDKDIEESFDALESRLRQATKRQAKTAKRVSNSHEGPQSLISCSSRSTPTRAAPISTSTVPSSAEGEDRDSRLMVARRVSPRSSLREDYPNTQEAGKRFYEVTGERFVIDERTVTEEEAAVPRPHLRTS